LTWDEPALQLKQLVAPTTAYDPGKQLVQPTVPKAAAKEPAAQPAQIAAAMPENEPSKHAAHKEDDEAPMVAR
jgi:hypothetical protein